MCFLFDVCIRPLCFKDLPPPAEFYYSVWFKIDKVLVVEIFLKVWNRSFLLSTNPMKSPKAPVITVSAQNN